MILILKIEVSTQLHDSHVLLFFIIYKSIISKRHAYIGLNDPKLKKKIILIKKSKHMVYMSLIFLMNML